MRWKIVAAALLKWRWKRVLAGLVAALVLLPTPAMALTFLGSWVPSYSQSGGPLPPPPTFTDSLTHNGATNAEDVLTVDMGDYTGSTALAVSSIQLTRQFQITAGAQTLQLAHSFQSIFQQAGATVTVAIKNKTGSNTLSTPINYSATNTTSTPVTLSDSETVQNSLHRDIYTLVVTVTYKTNNKLGSWKKKSQHEHDFDFLGL